MSVEEPASWSRTAGILEPRSGQRTATTEVGRHRDVETGLPRTENRVDSPDEAVTAIIATTPDLPAPSIGSPIPDVARSLLLDEHVGLDRRGH
jgi:hypothetical protein